MKKYLGCGLLLTFLLLHCALVPSCYAKFSCPVDINMEQKTPNITLMSVQLMDWCANDPSCSKVYHQTPQHKNFTIFRHLIRPQLGGRPDLYKPIHNWLCSENSLEEIARQFWILSLLANRDVSQPICDNQHRLQFDPHFLTSRCVCGPGELCSEDIFDLIPFYVLIGLLLLAALMFLIGTIYSIKQTSKLYDTILEKKGAILIFIRFLK